MLVSDKEPGPELELALLSSRLWRELAATGGGFEYEPKGGLVVAETPEVQERLVELAAEQDVPHEVVPADGLRALEPELARRAG
ncbi:FAD-dependent oxidoreductase [Nonomuraea ferruginea]